MYFLDVLFQMYYFRDNNKLTRTKQDEKTNKNRIAPLILHKVFFYF